MHKSYSNLPTLEYVSEEPRKAKSSVDLWDQPTINNLVGYTMSESCVSIASTASTASVATYVSETRLGSSHTVNGDLRRASNASIAEDPVEEDTKNIFSKSAITLIHMFQLLVLVGTLSFILFIHIFAATPHTQIVTWLFASTNILLFLNCLSYMLVVLSYKMPTIQHLVVWMLFLCIPIVSIAIWFPRTYMLSNHV